jgi:peptidoglycan/LPS O-acetylase OafA/YrhL
LPFCLIVIFSILLISKIFNSRTNISTYYTNRERIIYRKDVHLSILAIVSNFLIISLNFPLFFIFFILKNDNNVWFVFALHIYHLSYAFQFYLLFFANSMFRKTFISVLKRTNETNKLAEVIEMIAY